MSLVKIGILLAAAAAHEQDAELKIPVIELPPVREAGLASWYGDGRLHGAITASGEPIQPEAFTCAHRTLPFDTMVLLVNKGDRSRRVWCRINDRGPWGMRGEGDGARYRGILDVAVGAAKALGTYRKGLEPIEIRFWTRDTRAPEALALLQP